MTLRLRGLALSLICLAALALPSAAASAASGPGTVRFAKEANSAFDRFTTSPSAAEAAWMRDRYDRMKTYSGYFDSRTSWYGNAWAYKDLYAIYKHSSAILRDHPEWILRDAQGDPMYIPWGCGQGTCPQYAADITNPAFRAHWIAEARATLGAGYRGLFIDDVNMELRVSDANGHEAPPIDRRTGRPMTSAAWRAAMADFVVQVREEVDSRFEVAHNPIWFSGHDDPDVARALMAADVIDIERGVNDGGLTAGGGTYGLETLLAHVDWLHARGKSVFLDSYTDTREGAEYNMAAYFLVSRGRDTMGTQYRATPADWWTGYDVDLGPARGERYEWNGLLRRDFADGYVLVNQPGRRSRTVATPDARGPDGAARPEVTLAGGQGAVVVGSGSAARAPAQGPEAPAAPGPVQGPQAPAPVQGPAASASAAPRPAGSVAATTTNARASAPATPTLRLRTTARRGRVSVRGSVSGHRAGRAGLRLYRRVGRSWRHVARTSVGVRADGTFTRAFTRLPAGRYQVRASYLGAGTAVASSARL